MAYGMTNNNWEKVKEELTCAICQDLLNEPRSLPCLHSFCTGCLKELLAGLNSSKYQLECPLCRAKVSLSASRAIEELPVNFVTNRLIEIFRCEEQARLHTIPPSATSLDPEATVNGTSSQPPSVQSRLGYCSSSRSPPPPSRSWLLPPPPSRSHPPPPPPVNRGQHSLRDSSSSFNYVTPPPPLPKQMPQQPTKNSNSSNLASLQSLLTALPGRYEYKLNIN